MTTMERKQFYMNLSVTDAAYIAGLFDGEGCVTCKKKPTKRKDRKNKVYDQWYIRCELAMTDKMTVEWLHKTLGFGWCKAWSSGQQLPKQATFYLFSAIL